MHELAPLIRDLAVILCMAGLMTIIFQWIKQPVVLGYLVAGLIIGPHTPPYALVSDTLNIRVLAELGVIFLMFSLGLEFSFHKLKRVGGSAFIVASVEVLFMLAFGFALGRYFDWSAMSSLFLGAALAISSTTIIIKAIDELNLKQQSFAQLIFAILIVEDLLAILLLVLLNSFGNGSSNLSSDFIWNISKLFMVVGSWFLIGYFFIPTMMRRVGGFISNETLIVVAIGLCLLLVVAAAYFHYSVALGAFMMGSILAETPQGHRIEELVQPLRDVFAAVFFVAVGMLIDPSIIWQEWKIVLLISAVTIFGKLIVTSLGGLIAGKDLKDSLQVGFGMAQIGEFSFIIIALGLSLKVVNPNLYAVIVAVSGFTAFTTPYGIRWSERASSGIAALLPAKFHLGIRRYGEYLNQIGNTLAIQKAWRIAIARFLVNALIVAILFSSSIEILVLLPEGVNWTWLAASWTITMLISSPFLAAMLFAYQEVREQLTHPILVASLTWIIALIEIALLSEIYFAKDVWTLSAMIISMLCIVVLHKPLLHIYFWFAARLVSNLAEGEKNLEVK